MAVPSYPSVHVTGAVHHYIQTLESSDIYYLGTAEVTPQMQVRAYSSKTMNDRAGRTLPIQKHWDGEAATVSVLLTYFSKFSEEALQRRGVAAGIQLAAGKESRWARGSAIYGKATFKLWQVYDNYFNPAGTSEGLEIGWYWPQVELLQRDTVKCGAQGEGLLLVMDCTPQLAQFRASNTTGALGAAVGEGNHTWTLFSQEDSLTVFPAAVRVPQ